MIALTPMTESEYRAFAAAAVRDYAADKAASGEWPADAAPALSRQAYDELVPHGLATPAHCFFTLVDPATTAAVGTLWIATRARAGRRIAYVYGVNVDPAHQRQGHATAAFRALEDWARSAGLAGIALHVFGHNTGAQALYRRLGFETTDITMYKPVDGETASQKA